MRSILLILFAFILVAGIYLAYTNLFVEEVPEYDAILHESTKNANFLGDLDYTLEINIPYPGIPLTSFSLSISDEGCKILNLTSQETFVLKCNETYYFTSPERTISCSKLLQGWSCAEGSEQNPNINLYISNKTIHKIINKYSKKIDGRKAYCYDMEVLGIPQLGLEFNITAKATQCFDKHTKIPIFLNITVSSKENAKFKYLFYYKIYNIKVNLSEEEYRDLLTLPAKIRRFDSLNVAVSPEKIEISSQYRSYDEDPDMVILLMGTEKYNLTGCYAESGKIVCNITNETFSYLMSKPGIQIIVGDYLYYDISPKVHFEESLGGILTIHGTSVNDFYLRYLVICYNKQFDINKKACEGYEEEWNGDYFDVISSEFKIEIPEEGIRSLEIVVSSPSSYTWTIEVTEDRKLVKRCENVSSTNPCKINLG